MQFIKYNLNLTAWRFWSAGACLKDCITLTFNKGGELVNVQVVVNYSSRRYGRMVKEDHNRYLRRYIWSPTDIVMYRYTYVIPQLDSMINTDYKSVNHFIRVFNNHKIKIERKGYKNEKN